MARIRNGQASIASVMREISASIQPPDVAREQPDRHAERQRDRAPRPRRPAATRARPRSRATARRGRSRRCRTSARRTAPCGSRSSSSRAGRTGAMQRREDARAATKQHDDGEADHRAAPRASRRAQRAARRARARAGATRAAAVAVGHALSARSRGLTSEVGDVGEQVQHDVGGRGEQHDALHHRVVAVEHRIDDQLAEAGDREHLLGQHRARQQRAELERAERDDRDQRVAQRVLAARRRARAGPWRARCARSRTTAPAASRCACGASAPRRCALPSTKAGMIIAARFARQVLERAARSPRPAASRAAPRTAGSA